MKVEFEFIIGFQVGVDYVEGIDTPDENVKVDLIRVSLGFLYVHLFWLRDA